MSYQEGKKRSVGRIFEDLGSTFPKPVGTSEQNDRCASHNEGLEDEREYAADKHRKRCVAELGQVVIDAMGPLVSVRHGSYPLRREAKHYRSNERERCNLSDHGASLEKEL